MTSKCLSGVLIIALGFALCMPARASSGTIGASNGEIAGVIVGVAAGVAVVIIVAVHYSKKRSITGCVVSNGNGMSITDEKDKQIYALSGSTTAVKPGDRLKVKGRKAKHTGSDTSPVWDVAEVSKDFGVCQP